MNSTRSHRLQILVSDTLDYMKRAQLALVASSLSYTTILSLIPLLAVSFAIFQVFGGLNSLLNDKIEPFILSNLAEGVSDEVAAKLQSFIGNIHPGAVGIGGLLGLVVTSMSMLLNVEKAINQVWRAPLTRTLVRRLVAFLLIVTVGPLGLAIALGISGTDQIPLTSMLPGGTGAFIISVFIFFGVYKWIPHTHVNSRCAGIAGFVFATVFHLAQAIFRLYTTHVLSYSKIYGSLAAVPILLLWIYIVWIIVLTGAAFTAALQKQIAPTTLSPSPPVAASS